MTEGSDPLGPPGVTVYDPANGLSILLWRAFPMNSSDSGNHSDKAGEKVRQVLTDLAIVAGAGPETGPAPKPTNQALWDRLLGA
jgi:hypothetical protein